MPIIKSAIKRAKQAVVRRERNIATKKEVKQATKAFHAKPTTKTLADAQSAIDTAIKKNVINKHTAGRRKSSLSKIAKQAGVRLEASKKAPTTTAKATITKTPAKKPVTKTPTKVAKTSVSKATTAKKPVAAKKPATKK